MKYKVGDKVRVREDLVVDQWYGRDVFISEMVSFKEKIVTIKKIYTDIYTIVEDSGKWHWTEEMFLPVIKYNIGDKVLIKKDLEKGKLYGDYSVNEDMFSLRGEIVTICNVEYGFYMLKEDLHKWCWTDEMFSGKVSKDFIPKDPVSQNRLPEKESSPDIITVKTTKLKLYF